MSELERLLIDGADANTKDIKGITLLMRFAQKGDIDALRTLLAFGASTKLKDYIGYTALDYAISANQLEAVKFLVEFGGAVVNNNSYMLSIRKNAKEITHYFDTLDKDKQVFLREREKEL